MKITALHLSVTALLCSCCFSQDLEQLLFASMREAVAEIKSLSQRLTAMDARFSSKFDAMDTKFSSKFEELEAQISTSTLAMDTKFSSKFDELEEQISTNTLESIRGCSSSTREQLSGLKELMTTDECADSSHGCGRNAVCEDTILHYRCQCLPGYSGDGFNCEDIDECQTGGNRCHDDAQCKNVVGNYSCVCPNGYYGDGFHCEDIDECQTGDNRCHEYALCKNVVGNYSCVCPKGYSGDGFHCEAVCESPSKFLKSLGCITPIEEEMSWEAAKENCQKLNGRLISKLTSQSELDLLKQQFPDIITEYRLPPWVGINNFLWMESGDPIRLWGRGEPDRRPLYSHGYGCVLGSQSALGICSNSGRHPSLCQSSVPSHN